MTSTPSILKAFNNHLLEFIIDLISIFPNDVTLKTIKISVETLKKVNPRAILVGWQFYVAKKYKVAIYNGNIDYFLKKDYQDDLENDIDASYYLDIIEKLRKPLSELSEKNKEKAKEYLTNLTKLSELY